MKFGKAPTRVGASTGIGQVLVYVPADVPVTVNGRATVGGVDMFDQVQTGIQVDPHRSFAGSEEVGRLTLDLRVGYGVVRVVRGPPPPGSGYEEVG